MDQREFFNQFYRIHHDQMTARTLVHFFESVVKPRLSNTPRILELGCGNFSQFEKMDSLEARVTAIDFSSEAIKQAPKSNIIYQEKSLTEKDFFTENEFDLIFDSHCMNCLVQEKDREIAFENIFKALKPEGLFASELMVQPLQTKADDKADGKKVEMPLKMIKTARELEEEILSHNLKIIYFMISKDSSFVNEVNGEEIFCDVLRVIAKKGTV